MVAFTGQLRPLTKPKDLAGLSNGQLPSSILRPIDGLAGAQLHHLAARAWNAMRAHALRDGVVLRPTSTSDSYRTLAVQKRIFYDRYTTTYTGIRCKICNGVRYCLRASHFAIAACPGTSNHGVALAVDVASVRYGNRLSWLERNAVTYGFGWEVKSEPWHIRYTEAERVPAAVLAYERGTPPPSQPTPSPQPSPGGFLMALTDEQQARLYEIARELEPTLIRKAGTTYATSVCVLYRATGVKVPLKNMTEVNSFKQSLSEDRVIELPAWKYNFYKTQPRD